MNHQRLTPHRALVVQARFEPSRLAAACTADAYEYVVPLVQRRLSEGLGPQPSGLSSHTNRRAGAGGATT
jgi:hypothetical protein